MFRERFWATIALIFFAIWVVFRAPWYFVLLTGLVFLIMAFREFFYMMDKKGYTPLVFFGTFWGSVIYLLQFIRIEFSNETSLIGVIDLSVFFMVFSMLLIILLRKPPIQPIACMGATLSGVFYIAWPFSLLLKIRYFPGVEGGILLFFLILVTKATDIAAYVTGSMWGKRKLVPDISPGKTLEGAVGGIIGAFIMAIILKLLFGKLMFPLGWGDVMAMGLFLGFFSQIGDVIESMIKRDSGMKDSGRIIPGVGGVLDLFDSLLVTGPLMYLYLLARV